MLRLQYFTVGCCNVRSPCQHIPKLLYYVLQKKKRHKIPSQCMNSGPRDFFLNFLFYIGVYLINNVVIVSSGQQSKQAYIYIYLFSSNAPPLQAAT